MNLVRSMRVLKERFKRASVRGHKEVGKKEGGDDPSNEGKVMKTVRAVVSVLYPGVSLIDVGVRS
jgi:hypothetical protein